MFWVKFEIWSEIRHFECNSIFWGKFDVLTGIRCFERKLVFCLKIDGLCSIIIDASSELQNFVWEMMLVKLDVMSNWTFLRKLDILSETQWGLRGILCCNWNSMFWVKSLFWLKANVLCGIISIRVEFEILSKNRRFEWKLMCEWN